MPTLADQIRAKTGPVAPSGGNSWLTMDLAVPIRRALEPVLGTDLDLEVKRREASHEFKLPSLADQIRSGAGSGAKSSVIADAQSGKLKQNPFVGFASSAISSLPEFFGMKTPVESEVFRIQNPWLGFASELVGPGGAYGAAFKISKAGRFVNTLEKSVEGSLKVLGREAIKSPKLAGVLREAYRFTPLEISRIGVGYTVFSEEDRRDDLIADVVTSTALNGAFGGLGGWIKSGGAAVAKRAFQTVVGGKSGFLPTFELRMMKDTSAKFTDDVTDVAGLIKRKTDEVLASEPGKGSLVAEKGAGGKYIYELNDVESTEQGLISQLFKRSSSRQAADTEAAGVDVRFMSQGTDKQGRVPKAVQQAALKMFGLEKMDDLAANFVFPRATGITTERHASTLATALDKATGVQTFKEEGVFIAKEGDGLWVVGKRLGKAINKNEGLAGLKPEVVEAQLVDVTARIQALRDSQKAAGVKRWDGAALGALKTMQGEASALKAAKNAGSKAFGSLEMKAGDLWFIAKTDRLDLVLPEIHARQSGVIAEWAKQNAAFRPGVNTDVFTNWMDTALGSMDHTDWSAMKAGKINKAAAVSRIMQQMQKNSQIPNALAQTGGMGGLSAGLAAKLFHHGDSAALKSAAEGIYHAMVPTARKEISSATYQRIHGMLEGVMNRADELSHLIMQGKSRFKGSPIAALRGADNVEHSGIWDEFGTVNAAIDAVPREELGTVIAASNMSDPAAALLELSESGLVSDAAKTLITTLQGVNKKVLDEFVRPALTAAKADEKIVWLEGHTGMPKIWKGDNFIDIKQGKSLQYRVTGGTAQEAEETAKAIIEEAKVAGKSWEAGATQKFSNVENQASVDFNRMVQGAQVGSANKDAEQIIMQGLQRAKANRPRLAKVHTPQGLVKERGDLKGTEFQSWTHDEVKQAIGGHYKQLLRYSAHEVWNARWEPELAAWGGQGNKAFMEDIQRKATQFAGIEGQFTKAANSLIKDAFGLGNKSFSEAASFSSGLMYNLSLGIFNTTFAVLNVLTPLMTVTPWLSMMTQAPTETMLKYMQTMPKYGRDGKPTGVMHSLLPMKLMGQAMKSLMKPVPELKAHLEKAITDGVIGAATYENFVGGAESMLGNSLRQAALSGGMWQFVKTASTAPALKSEQMSRMIAFNAVWHLGKDFYGLADDALYNFAKKGTKQTMYGYGLTDRPRIMTGPVGSIFGLFKNWQAHYIHQMWEYAGLATKEAQFKLGVGAVKNGAMERGAFGPMMWMMGTSGMVGGLGAMGPAKMLLDGMANNLTESPTAFHWLQQHWGNAEGDETNTSWGDVLYFGLPAMMGASLQSSASMPGSDLMQDSTNLTNIVGLRWAANLGTVALDMGEYAANSGQNPMHDPNLRAQFFGATMPRALSRIYAATQADTENSILSMRTGYPSVGDVSPTTRLLYGLGLNQVQVDRYQVASRELYKDQEKVSALMKTMGKEYAQGMMHGDSQEMQRVVDKAVMLGLPVGKVLQSAHGREERAGGDMLDRFDKVKVAEYVGRRGE